MRIVLAENSLDLKKWPVDVEHYQLVQHVGCRQPVWAWHAAEERQNWQQYGLEPEMPLGELVFCCFCYFILIILNDSILYSFLSPGRHLRHSRNKVILTLGEYNKSGNWLQKWWKMSKSSCSARLRDRHVSFFYQAQEMSTKYCHWEIGGRGTFLWTDPLAPLTRTLHLVECTVIGFGDTSCS